MKTIYEKIDDGDYRSTQGYPTHELRKSDPDAYWLLRKRWNEEEDRLRNQFRHDLEEDFGMLSHTLRDALWDTAWSAGHSSGYSEVVGCYEEFYERFIYPLNDYMRKIHGVNL
jgi:hypothetical protein